MLRITSIVNIGFALIYYVFYLLSSYSYALIGIFLVVTSSTMILVKLQKGLKITLVNYIFGSFTLVFALFLCNWVYHVILSSISYYYFGNTWLYITVSLLFILNIALNFIALLLYRPRS